VSGLSAGVRLRRGALELEAVLHCKPGEVAAVVGPTGAGKTTLLRCIAGLEPRLLCHGFVVVGEETWQNDDEGAFLPPHRRRVGMVFQEGRLFPHLDVRGNLGFGRRRRRATLAVDAVASELGLDHLLDRGVEDLSAGERQRVALARALLAAPALLLLDEPLAAVDPAGRNALGAALLHACRRAEVPVVLVTHSRAEVQRLADTVSVLRAGKVVASGPVAAMTTALAAVPPEPGEDLAALVEAWVVRHDEADALTYLDFPGGTFAVPRLALASGSRYRLLVQARDVSVALAAPLGSSILNVFPARIEAIEEGPEGAQPLLRLRVGETLLLARVSRRSLRELALVPGQELFAQVKAVALA
jgi:molybdate transport system ATP-binding protein